MTEESDLRTVYEVLPRVLHAAQAQPVIKVRMKNKWFTGPVREHATALPNAPFYVLTPAESQDKEGVYTVPFRAPEPVFFSMNNYRAINAIEVLFPPSVHRDHCAFRAIYEHNKRNDKPIPRAVLTQSQHIARSLIARWKHHHSDLPALGIYTLNPLRQDMLELEHGTLEDGRLFKVAFEDRQNMGWKNPAVSSNLFITVLNPQDLQKTIRTTENGLTGIVRYLSYDGETLPRWDAPDHAIMMQPTAWEGDSNEEYVARWHAVQEEYHDLLTQVARAVCGWAKEENVARMPEVDVGMHAQFLDTLNQSGGSHD